MRITENKLRRIIRSIIREVRAENDEELLSIGGDIASTYYDRYSKDDESIVDENKLLQLFKAWCNMSENNIEGMSSEEIVYMFFQDYPEHAEHLERERTSAYLTHRPKRGFYEKLHNHAKLASVMPNF